MATPLVNERRPPPVHLDNRPAGAVEALCAAGGIVLAIIGLAGAPRFFDGIAVIVVGAAFLFELWTVVAGASGGHGQRGLWLERIAGWVGVVLGVLALFHVTPVILCAVALIVFGAGLTLGMGLVSRTGRVAVGIGAVVLGILAVLRLDPRTLTLIGLIGVSGMLLLTGPLVGRRVHGTHAPAV